jgi:hypothetical protein
MLLLGKSITPPNLSYLLFFISVVALWAMMQPGTIRDDDHRHLPDKPIARLIFTLITVVLFSTLVVCLIVLPGPVVDFARDLPTVGGFFRDVSVERFSTDSPIFAALIMGAMTQIPFIKDFERSILIRLHSASNLLKDVIELDRHLRHCRFEPSPTEHQRNLDMGKKYGVYVDSSDFQAEIPLPMLNWRKVSSLVRLVREWNDAESNRVLTVEQMELLDTIERAHERKTGVVLEIVRLVEQVESGVMSPETLMRSLRMLDEIPNADRESIERVEAQLRNLIGEKSQAPSRPLRISSSVFRRDIARIGGYFQEEYEILLAQISGLAARSIVLSGSLAPGRLEALKLAGFSGLGHIEPISLDRALVTVLGITFLGFTVLFVGNLGRNQGPNAADRIARFAFIMSIAALTGSLVGAHRRYAKAADTPWAIYFAAGLFAALVMIAVNWIAALVQQYQGVEPPAGQQPFALARIAPWSLLPFLATVAICRLARMDNWLGKPAADHRSALIERALDGLCVSLTLLLGTYGAIALLTALGEELPPTLRSLMEQTEGHRIMPYPILWPLQFLGFLMGFLMVRDVRRGAHSRIIAWESGATIIHTTVTPPSSTDRPQAPAIPGPN